MTKLQEIASSAPIILDGKDWMLSIDPENIGKEQQWYREANPEARPTRVPWIIQDAFPGYHGVVWYWHDFAVSRNPHKQGRYLLRFWAVDYMADVWLNGQHVGGHEGGETPFVLDVTESIQPGAGNRLAVRVLNPTHERIDGIVLNETPHRCKGMPYVAAGGTYNHGGIVDSVELLTVPSVYIEDTFCWPDPKTGLIHVQSTVRNAAESPTPGHFVFSVAPASGGRVLNESSIERELPPGKAIIEATLQVDSPHLWELNDPSLYAVMASVRANESDSIDEHSTRCGFRDFRFENGYFRLNGRRIFLRSSHTVNHYPIGLQFPHDPDLARRDMLNAKVMGFNMVRFIWGGAMRSQLDLCDELGLMVYNESYASNPMVNSPSMTERFNSAVTGIIRRDRNHPSVVIWGLLNETLDCPVFNHAVSILPAIRSLDNSRVIMLNSGRFDGHKDIGSLCNPGEMDWEHQLLGAKELNAPLAKSELPADCLERLGDVHPYPRVPHTATSIQLLRSLEHDTKHVFLSEYGVGSAVDLWHTVRHYERLGKDYLEDAKFYQDKLNLYFADWESWRLDECFDRPEDFFLQSLEKMSGQRTLGLNAIRSNPNLVGYSLTGLVDQVMTGEGLTTTFREFKPGTMDAISDGWAPLRLCLFVEPINVYSGSKVKLEAVLANEDALPPGEYPVRLRVVDPRHIHLLDRTVSVRIPDSKGSSEPPFALPIFSEEILIEGPSGKYRFLATFEKGAAAAGGKTEFHVADPAEMPAVDTEVVLWGEDDELLQWLSSHGIHARLFSAAQQLENEVILVSAEPAESGGAKAFDELVQRINGGATAVFLSPDVFKAVSDVEISDTVRYDGGGFEVANVPKEDEKYFDKVLWGDFTYSITGLPASEYVVELGMCEGVHLQTGMRIFDVVINGITVLENFDIFKEVGGRRLAVTRHFPVRVDDGHVKIHFVDRKNGASLCRLRIFDPEGKQVLEHGALAYKGYPAFPFKELGTFAEIYSWLYLKDEWAKNHPIFEGLPSDGLMDNMFYREIIPDVVFATQKKPDEAVAGAIKASQDYSSGLMVSVHNHGKGRFILNTLLIRENLGKHPAAERLLRNMLRHASRKTE